ncbi:MAG: ATP-dependent DNA helicase RecG [Candidatus Campbellbacteria bacterium]
MQLSQPIEQRSRISESQRKALKKLGVETVEDVLYHFPARYVSAESESVLEAVPESGRVSLVGSISKTKARKAWKSRVPMTEATLKDDTGSVKLLWMHQPYIAKMFPEGTLVVVSGKVQEKDGKRSMFNPEITRAESGATVTKSPLFKKMAEEGGTSLFPVYPESRGVTSRWFYYTIQKLLSENVTRDIPDPIPEEILKRYNLPKLATALTWIHAPKKEGDALAARKRFAFQEIFLIQLAKQRERAQAESVPSWRITPSPDSLQEFISRFPFTPTKAQLRAIDAIVEDFAQPHAMSRLLEGDVGSGKTFVAAATAYAVVTSRPDETKDFGNLQIAYMAPTEILAQQHFESFISFFRGLPIQIGLITSSGCRKFPSKVNPGGWTDISRTQLLKWVANGEIPILIGTHALIQKSVKFKHLACVYIDEQHRFGTKQRAELARKTDVADKTPWRMPHLLSMTATPIPRTLALTVYGDLDLTLLDELPPGRKKIITKIVPSSERSTTYEAVRTEVASGRQAYVICPRIDEPDPTKELALRAKSVEAEAKRLVKDVFPEFEIGVLHGKMKPKDKDAVMKRFADGDIDILVATSVVEVGVNVPNATSIIIEGAERFGLSQLHQLRGRVFRSTHQSYCYLFAESKGETTTKRLEAIASAEDGFALAEKDLEIRGSGELVGGRQWGITDVGMEALRNLKMVEAARTEAHALIKKDPELSQHPELCLAADAYTDIHFE